MQRGPPRPVPQLGARDRQHLDPLGRQAGVRLGVALVRDDDARRERERVVAVVPLLALGGHRVQAGVDDPQLRDLHRGGGGAQERLRARHTGLGDHVGLERVRDRRVHDDGVAVDHRADGVEVHRGAVLGDRDREHRVRLAGGEQPLRERLHAGRRGALADADREHARGEHEHVAALEPRAALGVAAVEQRRAGEARVVAVDRRGDRGLAATCVHRQGRDRDAVAQPHARVAREEQVRQRRHDEVLWRRHPLDQAVAVAQLLAGEPGHEHLGEARRRGARTSTRAAAGPATARSTAAAGRRRAPPSAPPAPPAPPRAGRARRAPRRRARAACPRIRRARPGPSRPTAPRRTAARRCCAG